MSYPQYLTKRHGIWHFLRRVPTEYAHLDPRGNVKLSTKIKVAADPKGIKASQVATLMNDTVEAYWHSLADQKTAEARQTYPDAVRLARAGLNYQTPLVWTMARAKTTGTRAIGKPGCQLYRHFGKNGALLYVGISLSAVNRLRRHKTAARWFYKITKVTVERFESREAALLAERIAIRDERPRHNIAGATIVEHA